MKVEIKKKIVSQGQLLFTGPMVDHAMFYTEETEIIVLSKNPRDQKTYEEDTVRIDFMNDNNADSCYTLVENFQKKSQNPNREIVHRGNIKDVFSLRAIYSL